MTHPTDFNDRMLSLGLARVSERAAMASAELIGRGDEKAADQAAVNAMREQLNKLDIKGVVVIGEGERDEAPMLYIGEEVGSGNGPEVDIALDPLEGTTLTAKDMPNALTVIAMAPRGTLLHAPDVYMEKLAIGPGYRTGVVTLDMPPAPDDGPAVAGDGGGTSRSASACPVSFWVSFCSTSELETRGFIASPRISMLFWKPPKPRRKATMPPTSQTLFTSASGLAASMPACA